MTDLLNLVQLDFLADRLPSQLSGGQRQRIALARALAVEPKVLLLDEPFGALDANVRRDLRRWLRRLHDEIHLTSVFVTHDQEEAIELADRVVIINHGIVEQDGTVEEVVERPANPFVMNFFGTVNVFRDRPRGGSNGVLQASRNRRQPHARPTAAWPRRSTTSGSSAPSSASCCWTREGAPIHVEMTRERFDILALRKGEPLHVMPNNPRVFVEP